MIVTVVGTGYVGLVTGVCLAVRGHQVRCVDEDEVKVRAIRSGNIPFHEPGLDTLLRDVLHSGALSVTADLYQAIQGSHISIIAVGTPSKLGGGDADLRYVKAAAQEIGATLCEAAEQHVVVVKSTVVPGTTRSLVLKVLETESGLKAGIDFGLCMNPEFLQEGSAIADFMKPDRIIVGCLDLTTTAQMEVLYDSFHCEKLWCPLETAELIKYANNALLANLVSFSNELAALCEATAGTDVETVLQGVRLDRRWSPVVDVPPHRGRIHPGILTYLKAGIGYGGSCLPKDIGALIQFAKSKNVHVPLLEAVREVNLLRENQIRDMAQAVLGDLKGKTITLLGYAFKAGTDDLRDSPAVHLAQALRLKGANVRAFDPLVKSDDLTLFASPTAALTGADAVVLTNMDETYRMWAWEDYLALMNAPVLIDGRGILRDVTLPAKAQYYTIGRKIERGQSQSA